jgi:hypothetical protein
MNLAPLVLFVYRRAEHTSRTLASLAANPEAKDSDLYVFADGAKGEADRAGVEATRALFRRDWGFKSLRVVSRERNWGLARNVVDGVSAVLAERGRAIILEDDIEVSPAFLEYLNRGLELYAEDPRVASIHGYVYPHTEKLPETFFLRGADCWGWATWERAWRLYEADAGLLESRLRSCPWENEFDFDRSYPYRRMLREAGRGRVDSWAVRWYASAFLAGMYTLYPGVSLARNSGHDGSGTHGGASDRYEVPLASSCPRLERLAPATDPAGYEAFRNYFLSLRPSLRTRLRRRLLRR